MAKLKTDSGYKKRFKVTGSGKVVRRKGYKNHILTKKTAKRKRRLRKGALVSNADAANIKQLLPYA